MMHSRIAVDPLLIFLYLKMFSCEFLKHFATYVGGWNEWERYCIYECDFRDNYVDDRVSRRQERHTCI